MIYTTLNRIREHNSCADGWRKLLTHLGKNDHYASLAYSTILDAVGLDDALWCLRAELQHASIWRMYAVRCARRVQHLMEDERSIRALDVALDVAERYARGEATDEELAAARTAAWVAARAAASDVRTAGGTAAWATWAAGAATGATWATTGAAWAAAAAAWAEQAAAGDTARAEQTADFRAMLAAHHAMPGESCALVDWWQGASDD